MIERRQFIGSVGVLAASPSIGANRILGDDGFNAAALGADTEHYAGFGIHQTGSTGDLATGEWVAHRLQKSGFEVGKSLVEVPFFEPALVALEHDNLSIKGMAQHPVTPTGAKGVIAPIIARRGAWDDAKLTGKIALVALPYGRHSSAASPMIETALLAAKAAGALGIVLITDGPTGHAIALNADKSAPFSGIPIIVMGSNQAAALNGLAEKAATVRLIVSGQAGYRSGYNIIAKRPGAGKALVLSTPLSGWFRCAGERGSGVAAWLAIAEWLSSTYPDIPLTVAGLVGHEFENLGSKSFMATTAPSPSDVRLWLHIGSGFATRDWHEAGPAGLLPLPSADPQRFLIASPQFIAPLQDAMRGIVGLERPYAATPDRAAGEAKAILAAGYDRLIANFGGHRFHHTTEDGPQTTSGLLTAQAANAVRNALLSILAKA